ncbi:pyruvate dehydrogenase complex dihydrolipoamide acetyltransferase [Sphingosinicella xenopeptidilytica]|uniref:Acetyltransferase component of pyruvate dehydrogenase complex n=1 Tax=Sphingosinicella xenopeptidilytica TaxID=364098 RepID=A0ABW3C6M5_SPHXN
MPIDITMPALSPTMETGTLAKWLVKEGDKVSPGDVIAEIETDKATMEVEAIDEGVVAKIVVAAGTEDVPVGQLIAVLAEEGEAVAAPKVEKAEPKEVPAAPKAEEKPAPAPEPVKAEAPKPAAPAPTTTDSGDRLKASPLARRIAEAKGIDLGDVQGSGPGGRVVKADLDVGKPAAAAPTKAAAPTPVAAPAAFETEIPHEAIKLSNMRKTIARRLTEAKQTIPHIYLTVDIELDALLKLRGELNAALEARGVKLSVNDLLIKALATALIEVPECNVSISGDQLFKYSRADVSVAVSIPNGLITPIIVGANGKSLSAIATEMKELAGRAKEGKLQPHDYQGGTASISNMGMYGIKQFEAVINPPQGMIMAIGAGEKRPFIVNDALAIATVMSATGSFDHRAIDGADGARLMQAFKSLVENPLTLLA